MKKILISLFYLFFPLLIGSIVGFITSSSIDYNSLIKPLFSPPSFLFPIIWSIIYLLLGISYFILKKNNKDTPRIRKLYYFQLFVNALWSIIFFSLKWRFFAIIWILLLDVLVIAMVSLFFERDKKVGYLNIPYVIWSIFATYLTIGIYILN